MRRVANTKKFSKRFTAAGSPPRKSTQSVRTFSSNNCYWEFCKSSTMFSGKSLSISSDVPFSFNRATNHGAPPTHGNHKESRDDRRSARSYASQLSKKPDGGNSFSSGIPYLVNIPVSTEEKYCKSFGRICNNAMRSNGFSCCAINKSDEVKVGKDGFTARRVQLRCISKLST